MIVCFPTVFLLCNLCVAQFSDISQPVSFQTAELGDSVTIQCQIKSAMKSRVWYKLTTGRKLQLIATTHGSANHHYSVKFDGPENHLSISATTWEDTGTYYCGVVYPNFNEFGPGTFLMLKGIAFTSKSVQPGDSVTLSCSVHTGDCGGEDTSVFWLKSSESSGPEMIYFYGNRNDSCERTETGSPQTSCVYKLPKQNLSSDDAGTYYCVVASCGETLFGNGTKLHIERNSTTSAALSPAVIALVLSNIVLGMATLLLVWVLCKSRSKDPTEKVDGSSNSQQASDAVTYAAVSVAARSSSSRAATVKHSRDAVLYSEVRHHQQD
ncbi:immunoglobulin kappa light chain-like [Myripristis murdjan]|uniref:immunoglobulin kappa light chain-like n=1 Tax=Myripristis murdjan TaxID=586833 RepID=UPI0011760E91|nr:immunoglobulin kappa light chain-like [Myripristis murdjan]